MQQQAIKSGARRAQTANDALNAPRLIAQLEHLKQQLAALSLALLAQIGMPMAGLGQQANGTSETANQMSAAQLFAKLMDGIS